MFTQEHIYAVIQHFLSKIGYRDPNKPVDGKVTQQDLRDWESYLHNATNTLGKEVPHHIDAFPEISKAHDAFKAAVAHVKGMFGIGGAKVEEKVKEVEAKAKDEAEAKLRADRDAAIADAKKGAIKFEGKLTTEAKSAVDSAVKELKVETKSDATKE